VIGVAVVLGLAVAGALLLPSTAQRAATPTTIPEESVALPRQRPPDPAPDAAVRNVQLGGSVIGAGWEELDAGPVAGRIGPTAVWTGSRLFVWGGFEPGPAAPLPGHTWRHDGALYDPETATWQPVRPLPDGVCPPRGPAVAYAAGDVIVLRLRTFWRPDCVTAAAYRPGDDSWEPLPAEFFRRVTWLKPMAWTGELFVAPRDVLAYDWAGGRTLGLPAFPDGWEDAVRVQEAHWAGDRVVAVGTSGVFEWEPDADIWRRVGPGSAVGHGSASAWSDRGLLVVDYRIGAEFYDTDGWVAPQGLPLVLHSCPVAAISAGGIAAVRMCSGMAVWDGARHMWVPVPLDDVTRWDPYGTVLVGADDTIYAVGHSLRRFAIERAADGSIVAPGTVPVGTMQLDIPAGFGLVSSSSTVGDGLGREGGASFTGRSIPLHQTIGATFEAGSGVACTVTSTITAAGEGAAPQPEDGVEMGPVSVHRPARAMLEGTAWRGGDGALSLVFDMGAKTLFARFADDAAEVVSVRCAGPDDLLSGAASALAAGLWSPWE
jgi:hypothetical protein